jgi:phosphopantothenoylcysteine decarboxylase/phosphopantothenate--cysteine ligase
MNILITAGPTREHIDDVRFISNASSGRMGYALAAAAVRREHDVHLVSGPVEMAPPEGAHTVRVTSAVEMLEAVLERVGDADVLIMAAAVSDWRPKNRLPGKPGKGTEISSVELVLNPDILAESTRQNPEMLAVAFALEAEMDTESALRKMESKGARMVVLNTIDAMGAHIADFAVYSREGEAVISGSRSKEELAEALLDLVERERFA